MGVFYEKTVQKPMTPAEHWKTKTPTSGLCLGCRHPDDERFSTTGHCRGGGDMAPTESGWPGFICTCDCRVFPLEGQG